MRSPLKVIDGWGVSKVRLIFHAVFALVTGGFWIPAAVLLEIYIASSKDHKLWKLGKTNSETMAKIQLEIDSRVKEVQDLLKAKQTVDTYADAGSVANYEIENVVLWESRERVTSVTSGTTLGKTRTGSVGLGWSDGIGWAASQGVTRGTIASSTSEMRTNEFTELDKGLLRIDKDFLAFIGNQFSRTGNYKELLAIQTDYVDGIGFSLLNAEKIWVIRFSSSIEKRIAQYLISIAHALATGAQPIEVWTRAAQDFENELSRLKKEIEEHRKKLDVLQAAEK